MLLQVTAIQWLTPFYPMGKTSIESKLNIPGKWGWFTMEIPGFITLLYVIFTLPQELGLKRLPWENYTMAGMFVCCVLQSLQVGYVTDIFPQTIHYLYRAVLSPLFLNPSMSPIHPLVWLMAFSFQVANGLSIGGWLGGHGPRTEYDWAGRLYTIEVGLVIWGWGLMANMYHDDDLREIRRAAGRRQEKMRLEREKEAAASGEGEKADGSVGKGKVEGVEKVYMLPKNGLFHWVLYAHYLCEWFEWAGFWMVGGPQCIPARIFFVNEIASMLPRAVSGKKWYVEKFGKEKVGNRKAVIPGIL